MNDLIEELKKRAGFYIGKGINHDNQDFTGRIEILPINMSLGIELKFSAVGTDGTLYHTEKTIIALADNGRPCLWTMNNNMPGLYCHELRKIEEHEEDEKKIIFGYNDPNDKKVFREEITIELLPQHEIGYHYSWGLPGGDFAPRSGLKLQSIEKLKHTRPNFIKHYKEVQDKEASYYRGSEEFLSIGSPLAKNTEMKAIGVHHEFLPSGRRTSWPHAESLEEEFAYVVEGYPEVWIDGNIYQLCPGDFVGFPSGTGITHTFINNSGLDVRLIVGGERTKKENKIYYPLHPSRREQCKDSWWEEIKKENLGSHDALPDAIRKKECAPLQYTGEVILESLKNENVLEALRSYLIKKRTSQMPNEKIKEWHINRYCVDEKTLFNQLPHLASAIHDGWYGHFFSDTGNRLIVIFKNKHFVISKYKDSTWDEMIAYGESMGCERKWTENIPIQFKIKD